MRARSLMLSVALVGALGAFVGVAGAGQTGQPPQKRPPLVIDSMAGRDLFAFYCASCHGRDGKGDGPTAASLKTKPADLTAISKRRGGKFPHDEIAAFVSGMGAPVAAHGSVDMPVWGPLFRGLDDSPARTKVRINNLVSYLESIQAR
jgi:mono/diheme cytochrome c family protein